MKCKSSQFSLWKQTETVNRIEQVGGLAALSWIYRQQNKADQSAAVLKDAEQIVLDTEKIAVSSMDCAEYAKSIDLRTSLIEITRILQREGHPKIGVSLTHLAEAELTVGWYKQARDRLSEAIAILANAHTSPHSDTVKALVLSSRSKHALADYEGAKTEISSAAKISGSIAHVNQSDLAAIKIEMAVLNADMGDYETSENLFIEAIPLLREHLDVTDIIRLNASLDYVHLFEVTGDSKRFADEFVRWTPKTGPINKIDFQGFSFGGEDVS